MGVTIKVKSSINKNYQFIAHCIHFFCGRLLVRTLRHIPIVWYTVNTVLQLKVHRFVMLNNILVTSEAGKRNHWQELLNNAEYLTPVKLYRRNQTIHSFPQKPRIVNNRPTTHTLTYPSWKSKYSTGNSSWFCKGNSKIKKKTSATTTTTTRQRKSNRSLRWKQMCLERSKSL